MERKIFRPVLFSGILILTAVFSAVTLSGAPAGDRNYSKEELSGITCKTVRIFTNKHYRQRPMNPQMAAQIFEAYLKALDGNRSFLTAEDVKSFGMEPKAFCEALKNGDNLMAFKVYERFRQRFAQYRNFAEAMLKKPVDFTKDENFIPDRSKLPRCANEKELQELWRTRVKNDLLFYRLYNRVLAESKDPADKKAREDAKRWAVKTPEQKLLNRIKDLYNDITKRDQIDILGIYLNALANVYGPHSNYMAPKMAQDFDIDMSLSLTGIGATLTSDDGYIKIVSIVPGGPAAKDGRLKVNDRIVAVTQENGETVDVIDMPVTKAVQYIRGKEKTKVTLTILPGAKGRNAAPERITITRDKVKLVDSEAKGEIRMVRGHKIGIINLPSFYIDFEAAIKGDPNAKRCSQDVNNLLKDFKQKNVEGVVMDLRRNGGGSLAEAITLSGLFMQIGPVVQRRNSNRELRLELDDNPYIAWTGPLVILTSKATASAAEIFSAAMRDCDRAVIVGDSRTFGKGTVLQVEDLETAPRFFRKNLKPCGSATYEIEMFYRTSGGSVQQLGLASDIIIPSLTEEMKLGEMFLENHLPWDKISAVSRDHLYPHIDKLIAVLKANSAKRIESSKEFKIQQKRVKLYREYRKRNLVTLNEEKRWKEYQEEKQFTEEEEKASGAADTENSKKRHDLVLNEAAEIAADWLSL